ncbi:hypothetical protein [Burkholderia sp. 8Y]|uniref:hypothetical protein n=1 Tax=Burkholderia sp. 8Y TaxID=2653133 RepID=UPI00135B3D1C|nr:hypothetical protein [Burkholderia sp. 8Y]
MSDIKTRVYEGIWLDGTPMSLLCILDAGIEVHDAAALMLLEASRICAFNERKTLAPSGENVIVQSIPDYDTPPTRLDTEITEGARTAFAHMTEVDVARWGIPRHLSPPLRKSSRPCLMRMRKRSAAAETDFFAAFTERDGAVRVRVYSGNWYA